MILKKGRLYGKEKISLPARETVEFETKPVTLYTWKTYNLKPVKAKVVGARVRLTYTPESGKPEVKEFFYPKGLKEQWDSTVSNAQANRNL